MSDMTTTVSHTKRNSVAGSKITAFVRLTFGTGYPANGEPFDATAYGVGQIDEVRITTVGVPQGNFVFAYEQADKKIKAFGSTTEASGAAVSEGAAIGAGAKGLIELANNSAALDGFQVDIAISGGR
tara:strand:- start:46374 stop:46754 length:381 start_codon:yes stop_codon:yes gene_type:complete